eukprot:1145213-Pelagomonas_calceolata.AAC.6
MYLASCHVLLLLHLHAFLKLLPKPQRDVNTGASCSSSATHCFQLPLNDSWSSADDMLPLLILQSAGRHKSIKASEWCITLFG